MVQPGIILLREGTDTSQGIPQLISNINACEAIVEIARTTLGPFGMDKMIITNDGTSTISNDGATVLKLLDVIHPAARTIVEIAHSQDKEIGDGTTSVVVLAGELLSEAKSFIEEGMHPRLIISGFRATAALARKIVRTEAILPVSATGGNSTQTMLSCAATSLSSKLVASQSEFFSRIVVRAIELLSPSVDTRMIQIRKEAGGILEDTVLVEGVAFQKTFSYAGLEHAPKRIQNPLVALLNVELEIKKERDNAEIRITDPRSYRQFVDAEWAIIYRKLDQIIAAGSNVGLSRLAIGDLATQYLAARNIFCAGRVPDETLQCLSRAIGGSIQSSTSQLTREVLGTCGLFEERQVGEHRYNFFTECPKTKSVTILLRGAGDQFIDEVERSLNDAIMVVRRVAENASVVCGAGAVEMHLSHRLHEHARTIPGKQQLIIGAFARALEAIPRQLVDNAGLDSSAVLTQLRKAHNDKQHYMGVNLRTSSDTALIQNSLTSHIWEPAAVKLNILEAATEATCTTLSIDETIKNKKANPN